MAKKLVKHGNSYALVIDKSIRDLLHIDPETPLELSTNGDVLIVSPLRDEERARRLDQILKKTNRKYAPLLKRLAE